MAEVKQRLAQPGLFANGVRYELGGLYQQQQIAFVGLSKVFALALVAEFVLLLFLYQRIVLAALVMLVVAARLLFLQLSTRPI